MQDAAAPDAAGAVPDAAELARCAEARPVDAGPARGAAVPRGVAELEFGVPAPVGRAVEEPAAPEQVVHAVEEPGALGVAAVSEDAQPVLVAGAAVWVPAGEVPADFSWALLEQVDWPAAEVDSRAAAGRALRGVRR